MGEPAPTPLILGNVLGMAHDEKWREWLHNQEHEGRLEIVKVAAVDATRKRMRLKTDRGREVALALPRGEALTDGAVLHASETLAIVARIDAGPRLRLTPKDAAAGLRLGYFCGNLHWKANFLDGAIEIVMDGPEEAYRARLRDASALCAFQVERLEPGG